MVYEPFVKLFPKIAEKETRVAHYIGDNKMPQGGYAFAPSYCVDKKCDCRRALVFVYPDDVSALSKEPIATISYGWEDFSFYRNWSNGLSDDTLKEFIGPALDKMQYQSKYSPILLQTFIDNIENDPAYVERLKRHYAFFKYKKGMRMPNDLQKLIQPLNPCPCDSGKIFKLCCGKTRSRFGKKRR